MDGIQREILKHLWIYKNMTRVFLHLPVNCVNQVALILPLACLLCHRKKQMKATLTELKLTFCFTQAWKVERAVPHKTLPHCPPPHQAMKQDWEAVGQEQGGCPRSPAPECGPRRQCLLTCGFLTQCQECLLVRWKRTGSSRTSSTAYRLEVR